ncbi:hypothetical protein L4174_022355 [Photobacterium sp. CCB-ST2H9]|uniref:hypothetical protein n=1 Tax=Photobacterium sp. CCB-ST2H9 TaxID=2912855 RepID=UPI002005451B|nr:hypothetical protein [Photobacterium sp. CCB-ST2H9]UTM59442.1 hypothetical protein L4174_022355 [Photobacterium sp. CCB-ST2H9]
MIIKNENEIFTDSFGLWVSGLFSAISGHIPEVSFDEQKDIFFTLLTNWMNEGKVFFCSPEGPLETFWDAENDEIISYLKRLWPESVTSELDSDLNLYFYEIPAIVWVGPGGTFIGS